MLTKFSVSRRKIVIAGRAIGTLDTEGTPKVPIKSPKTPYCLRNRSTWTNSWLHVEVTAGFLDFVHASVYKS